MEGAIGARAASKPVVEHVSLASDDGAVAVDELRASADPPRGPSARPYDLDQLAGFDGDYDQVILVGRDADRPEERRRAAEVGHQVRRRGDDMQAGRARRKPRTGP